MDNLYDGFVKRKTRIEVVNFLVTVDEDVNDLIEHFNTFTHEQHHISVPVRKRVMELYSRLKNEKRGVVYKGEIKVLAPGKESTRLNFADFMQDHIDYSEKLKERVWLLTVDQIIEIMTIIDEKQMFDHILDLLNRYYPDRTD